MIKVSKTIAEGEHMYINLHGFKDETEQDIVFQKIQSLIKEHQTRLRVY